MRGNATVANVASVAQQNWDLSQNLVSAQTERTLWAGPGAVVRFSTPQFYSGDDRQRADRFVRDPFVNNLIPRHRFAPVSAKVVADTEFFPLPNDVGGTAFITISSAWS